LADGGFDVDALDVSFKTYGKGLRRWAEKLNASNSVYPPDGLAFPLPSKIFPLPGAMWSELPRRKPAVSSPYLLHRASIRTMIEAQAVTAKKTSQRVGDGARVIETPHILISSASRSQVSMPK
jgi:hypothetical protein